MNEMSQQQRVFYGWWIVAAAFLNLFFAVGIIFYGFPVFYPRSCSPWDSRALKSRKDFFSDFFSLVCRLACWPEPSLIASVFDG